MYGGRLAGWLVAQLFSLSISLSVPPSISLDVCQPAVGWLVNQLGD